MATLTKFQRTLIAAYIEAADFADDCAIDYPDAERDCLNFIDRATNSNIDLTDFAAEYVGHDFWLTRNGHGAGFWDRPQNYGGEDTAEKLSDIARDFGEYC